MINMGVSEFRANMNKILQRVQAGEIVSLQIRGAEVARLVPPSFAQTAAQKELEALRETAVVGDLLAPIDEPWKSTDK